MGLDGVPKGVFFLRNKDYLEQIRSLTAERDLWKGRFEEANRQRSGMTHGKQHVILMCFNANDYYSQLSNKSTGTMEKTYQNFLWY